MPGDLADRAIGNRVDIQAALARFRGAAATARLNRTLRRGAIAVGPAYTFDKGDHRIGFTAAAELPDFSWPAAAGGRCAGCARRGAGGGGTRAGVRAGDGDCSSDGLSVTRTAEIAATRQVVADLAVQRARAERALAAGYGDRPAVLDAEARRLAAALAVVDAEARAGTALTALEDALQVPLSPADAPVPEMPRATALADSRR